MPAETRLPLHAVLGGKYRVERVIGSGGFGSVYQATQVDLGRQVAVKVLHREDRDGEGLVRFEREARATGGLGHPHIVQVTDLSLEDPPYLVMELLPGRSLAELLREEGRLEPRRAIRIAVQVLSALGAAHAIGIIHRDIKPANVMLVRTATDEDFVKVLDFGIAKDLGSPLTHTTESGAILGTVGYMAPEQALGLGIDERADLYAVGGLLYRMLAGEAPIPAGDLVEQLRLVAHADIVPLAKRVPSLPSALCAAVDRALAHDPAARFADATSFTEELTRATTTLAPRVDETARTEMDLSIAAAVAREKPRPVRPPRRTKTSALVTFAIAAVTVVIGAALMYGAYRFGRAPDAPPPQAFATTTPPPSSVAPLPPDPEEAVDAAIPSAARPKPSPAPPTPGCTCVAIDRARFGTGALCMPGYQTQPLCHCRRGASSNSGLLCPQPDPTNKCLGRVRRPGTPGEPCPGFSREEAITGTWGDCLYCRDQPFVAGPEGRNCTGFFEQTLIAGRVACR